MEATKILSARDRMRAAPAPVVAVLEPAKAARFNAKTMLIPSPQQVQDGISDIHFGESMPLIELRRRLAKRHGADVTCPFVARVCWELVAEAAEENRADGKDVAPWWRVTKDGKPSPKLPGGAERHRELLLAEGVRI